MSRLSHARRDDGLSLIELLVVLVIVGIVAALLMEGVGNALLLYQRVQDRRVDRYSEAMEVDWWRSSLAGSAPNRFQRYDFRGAPESIEFETFQPLIGPAGVATQASWQIEEDALIYRESTGGETVAVRVAIESGTLFSFRDDEGSWHRRWPRHADDTRIPRVIRMTSAEVVTDTVVTSHVEPLNYIDEIEFGRVD